MYSTLSLKMSTASADIVVFSKERRPVLVVDVRGGSMYDTVESAAGLLRSLLAHQLLPSAPFFMLATPTQLFLWPRDGTSDDVPKFAAATKAVLDNYGSKRLQTDRLRSGALEFVIFFWLADLASGVRSPSPVSAADRMLLESGLFTYIQGGTADFDVEL